MSAKKEVKGICTTCRHTSTCNRLKYTTETIWHCDEFEVEIPNLVEHILSKNNKLIAILEEVQKYYNYLPQETLKEISGRMKIPLKDVYGVATFYKSFSLKPRGKHIVSVCLGTACHVRGSQSVASEFEKQLEIYPGETTDDKEFTLETVNCLGACAQGPIVVVDGEYFSNVKLKTVKNIIDKTRKRLAKVDFKKDQRIFPVELSCPQCNHTLMRPDHIIDGYPAIQIIVSYGREHGWCRLSSLYGSFNFESEHEIPIDTKLQIFCPHCHTELLGAYACPECHTTMVTMIIRGGGTVQICPKRGCKGHILDT